VKKCYFCRGEVQKQLIDVIRKRKGQVFIIENVPALVCQKCGERYYTAEVAQGLDETITEGANEIERMINVPILSFGFDHHVKRGR